MAEKKREEFTVTDRRLFTPEGELRTEPEPAAEPQQPPQAAPNADGGTLAYSRVVFPAELVGRASAVQVTKLEPTYSPRFDCRHQ